MHRPSALLCKMLDAALLDATFAAPLRGEVAPWPEDWIGEEQLEMVRRRLIYHGIAGLLNEQTALLHDWPEAISSTLRQESIGHTMWELRHKVLIAEVVEALHAAGIVSVLLKGTALAYSLYANPALRFRGDSDLLIRTGDLPLARQLLAGLGWERPLGAPGLFGAMHYQEIWCCRDAAGLMHDIDLHWEVTNSMALKTVLNGEEVLQESAKLPALSSHALCADPVTGLIHRAVNRAEHARSGYFTLDRNEYDPNRLIWAVDIDYLTRKLSPAQWENVVERSIASGVSAIVLDALDFARKTLGTDVPLTAWTQLNSAPQDAPATRFLVASDDFVRAIADFKATRGLALKLGYVLARTFPAPAHMRAKFPAMLRWPLAFLHLRRLAGALMRLITGAVRK